ncbi:MAG TPA: cation:proton antiporter, partial [Deinococcales bacterium]|nr:cation:proton antiporter [Deinococcales bacterium]
MLYLAAGALIGPLGLGVLDFRIGSIAHWLERAAAVVVIVSLFVSGLKLRLPPRDRAWHAAYLLAGPGMILTVAGVAAAAHLLLGVDWP